MQVHYLEIVSDDVSATCAAYEASLGVSFSEPEAALGNARLATMRDGGIVGVRAQLSPGEPMVVRPYWLVADIEKSVSAAVAAGAQIAHPPLEIPGRGTFAIYAVGDVHHGLWQL
ncbi:MAG: VOC family protein [Gammaproteobacteria bacterium]